MTDGLHGITMRRYFEPITMKKTGPNSISRRDFVKLAAAAIGGLIGAAIGLPAIDFLISPALRSQMKDAWVPLGVLETIPIGVPTYFQFNRSTVSGWEKTVTSHGVYVVRKDANQVIALSNVCTHLGCLVRWHPELREYVSPCHNGHFDINGKVTFGPPPRPLDEYQTKTEAGTLSVLYPPNKRNNA